jgi:hypothetical protein
MSIIAVTARPRGPGGGTLFAMNSDREPDELQVMQALAPVRGDAAPTVRCTHITIDQVADRHGLVLSRPQWTWGGEVGVNDRGVCVGAAGVATRAHQRRPAGLIGVDLVRLALERADGARAAVHVIAKLLETHGQGGRSGFRHKRTSHDSVFCIADAGEAWVMETAGRQWVARPVGDVGTVVGDLTVDAPGPEDLYGGGLEAGSFRRRFTPRWLAGQKLIHERRSVLAGCLAAGTDDHGDAAQAILTVFRALRRHRDGPLPIDAHGGFDVCLHGGGGGLTRRLVTTGALVAWLAPGQVQVFATGTPWTCMSVFRPVGFEPAPEPDGAADARYWRHHPLARQWPRAAPGLLEERQVARDAIESQGVSLSLKGRNDWGARAEEWEEETLRLIGES